jgi:hypothetical protein
LLPLLLLLWLCVVQGVPPPQALLLKGLRTRLATWLGHAA